MNSVQQASAFELLTALRHKLTDHEIAAMLEGGLWCPEVQFEDLEAESFNETRRLLIETESGDIREDWYDFNYSCWQYHPESVVARIYDFGHSKASFRSNKRD